MAKSPVRLAIVGGRRGRSFGTALDVLADKVQLVAVCDRNPQVRERWKEEVRGIRTYERFEDLLDDSDVDAVLLATPLQIHAQQAVAAMKAGKHVLSEVIAATTIEECWELVETVESTKMVYMLAENYCYMRPNMMILRMVEEGVFGQLTYAEGAYIHDTRDLVLNEDGSLTWRGELRKHCNYMTYPTHSLGPIAQWFKVNRNNGCRLVDAACFNSAPRSMHRYVREVVGPDHPGSDPDFWLQGDSQVTIVRTDQGGLIVLRMDSVSPRPHNMTHYVLQGEKASYLSARHGNEDPLIWIEGRSPGYSPPRDGVEARWESLWTYAEEYEHPHWQKLGSHALKAGHGGGDLFVIADFVDSILHNTSPPIDVYDAVTWSSIVPVSAASVRRGGAPVEIPDFLRGRETRSA